MNFEPYKKTDSSSGVKAFLIEDESIEVEFKDGGIYLYTYESAGRFVVERMKRMAREGSGLSTFISQIVKSDYASKK